MDPRVFDRPLEPSEAIASVAGWLERPVARLVEPGRRHWSILADVCERGRARGALTADAHLAALAVEHGATLVTTDRDFARFDVDVLDPTT
jgi:toxin-antitoxin system PIN domain toxin